MFYPMGFPLLLETNCDHILDLASEMWVESKSFGHQRAACLLQLNLRYIGSYATPRIPRVQQRGLLTYFNADEDNFVLCDPAGGYAVGWISEGTVEQGLYVQQYFLRAIAMLMIAQESKLFSTTMGNGGKILQMPRGCRAAEYAFTGTHG